MYISIIGTMCASALGAHGKMAQGVQKCNIGDKWVRDTMIIKIKKIIT